MIVDLLGCSFCVCYLLVEIELVQGDLEVVCSYLILVYEVIWVILECDFSELVCMYEYFQFSFWFGYFVLQVGELELVSDWFDEYCVLVEVLVEVDDQNFEWLNEVGYVCNNFGIVYLCCGNLDEVCVVFEFVCDYFEQVFQ